MTTLAITSVGTDEITIPVSETSDIIVQTLSDGPPLGSYISDHSLSTNLGSDDHPQYLNIARGDARYTAKAHEEDPSIHFTQAQISIQPDQVVGYAGSAIFSTAYETKLNGIQSGAQVNYIGSGNVDLLTGSGDTSLHFHNSDRARANHTGTQPLSSVVNNNTINSPITNITLKDFINSLASAGITESINITDGGAGTLIIESAELLIRDDNLETATIHSVKLGANSSLVVPDLTTQYLYIDYNAGSPIWGITADNSTINTTDRVLVATVARLGAVLYIVKAGLDNINSNAKLRKKIKAFEGFTKSSGGVVSNPTALDIAVTQGTYWHGLTSFTHTALAQGGIFKYYFYNGSTWAVNTTAIVLNGTQYNNTASGLATLTAKHYCNHWVYATFGNGTTEYSVVYGQAQFGSLIQALEEAPPTLLPTNVANVSVLVGALTVYAGTNLIVSTRSTDKFGQLKVQGALPLAPSTPPATASDTGTTGMITWDASYIYVCIATNTWKRTTITTW